MNKREISIRPKKMIVVEFQDNEIVVDPIISVANKKDLVQNYIESITDNEKKIGNRFYEAECSLLLGIIDLNTSVDVTLVPLDDLVNGLWGSVCSHIENYGQLREEIKTVVSLLDKERIEENSFGVSFKKITEQISLLIDKISSVDLSKDGIAELFKRLDVEKAEIDKIINPKKSIVTSKRSGSSN